MAISLTFLGAAGNVTGSCYHLATSQASVVVDCGMFQERSFKARNWESFPFDPSSLSAIVLTHAHLDHVGRLPLLVRAGFRGHIYGSKATLAIAGIVLMDAGRLQEEDARHKRKRHEREGRKGPHPDEPLYDAHDAEDCLSFFKELNFDQETEIAEGITVSLTESGHILGASSIYMEARDNQEKKRILFSGDIGRWDAPILRDPRLSEKPVDVLLIESTYGDRIHEDNADIPDRLESVIKAATEVGGNILIPTFAVERAQDILYHLSYLQNQKRIPPILVFLDSPMASRVTEVFRKSPELMDEETVERKLQGIHPWNFSNLKTCQTRDQSKAINQITGTVIILAGSGMCTGGRIKHHLVKNIHRPETTLLFVGYQAEGTLGRHILNGEPEVRILGRQFEVKAKIERIEGFSGHAGQDELLKWTDMLPNTPTKTFVVHGEKSSARNFADILRNEKGWEDVTVPSYRDTVTL